MLFGLFILLCGAGHLLEVVTLWYPIYWISGLVKAGTALVSCYTAMELFILLPRFLLLKSPEELKKVNQELEATLAERMLAEKELEESQRTFRGAFDDAPIGMALVSLEGTFLKVNKAIVRMLGYSSGELLSTNFQSITHPDDLQADVALIQELMSDRRRFYQFEKRFYHKLGHVVPVELSVALLKDSKNDPVHFVAHIQDVSQQTQANASLKAATQSAKKANRAKSEFLATMSHEIRTPMNAMIGMAELLEETKLDRQQREYARIIHASGSTLLTVVNDILDFSKIESNKVELEMTRLDLYECVEDVVSLFSNQAEEKNLLLTSIIEPANIPDFFRGDATRLRQILSNLVSNSIKFTEKGEISIYVKVEAIRSEPLTEDPCKGSYRVHFSIKDTGVGIAEDKIPRLFRPFSQVDASITRRYGGTGLGLAISRKLVEMMDGSLSVESKVGEGSTFSFFIDLRAYDSANQTEPVDTQFALQQKRLLIVDSNELTGRYLRLQAESWNMTAEVVESAESALVSLFRNDLFDAIAIDETIADMESIQLPSQIRNFPNYQSIPIILLQTRKKSSAKRLNGLGNKARILQKPVRRSHFYNTLVELLLGEASIADQDVSPEAVEVITSKDKPLRILLTEDIPLNQKVAIQMLALYGYQADIANNGKEAVEAVKRQPYDLVFMDVQMPEIDGLEATRQIRAERDIAQPHIIAMTAHAMQGDREECISVGMNDYISKPIRKRDLVRALQQCPYSHDVPEKRLRHRPPAENSAEASSNYHSLEEELSATISERGGNSPSPIEPPIAFATDAAMDAKPQATTAALPDSKTVPAYPTLDTKILEGVTTDRSFLIELLSSFAEAAPKRMASIKAALDAEDASALRETAHALKALSSCVGAMSLFQICKSMEAVGKSNQYLPALPLIAAANAEYERVKVAIERYRNAL